MLVFAAPFVLFALTALPVLWWLLRATPPAPIRRRFPAVGLLLGMEEESREAQKTPWWLLLLRILALALAIIGFAGPVLNPQVESSRRPLLLVSDASWASEPAWPAQSARAQAALEQMQGRPVALLSLSAPEVTGFGTAEAAKAALARLAPRPYDPADLAQIALPEGAFDTLWLSDGLARAGRAELAARLAARGAVAVMEAPPVVALAPARVREGEMVVALRSAHPRRAPVEVLALGLDPAGVERVLAQVSVAPEEEAARFTLPPELRNRISRFAINGAAHAGAVSLTDDSAKRRKIALVEAGSAREGLELLSGLHYLRQAFAPSADLIEGGLEDVLLAGPDVVVLDDVAALPAADLLADWVDEGGVLIRFAGPRLAASELASDPLLPVALRAGGRSVGGTLSWGAPRGLAPFAPNSPFAGLAAPEEVVVRGQVVAEPSPELADHVIAALVDGTPLVTRAQFGAGQVVLFHVTANAQWSSLPLSGLFVQMLERLVAGGGPAGETGEIGAGPWGARMVLDARGALVSEGLRAGVSGADLAAALRSGARAAALPAGLYQSGERLVALNVLSADRALAPAQWPAGVALETGASAPERPLKGAFLGLALLLLSADILASLAVAGRLLALAALAVLALGAPEPLRAQEVTAEEVQAAGAVTLAYVETGEAALDEVSLAGLRGLSAVLTARTTVSPAAPRGVDLERDDLALYTLLYWPVSAEQRLPSARAYLALNRFLRAGGMILFDSRDADISDAPSAALQRLAAPLAIPPLEPIPQDHILSRSFYLLSAFPGRHAGGALWVEARAPQEGAQVNDGVTPVVIGGGDWASAWAVDEAGAALFPVGAGSGGARQREAAYRFGVNLVMHVLTGNYKADQVHVPALLERLGQ